jgi:hypothetical protein
MAIATFIPLGIYMLVLLYSSIKTIRYAYQKISTPISKIHFALALVAFTTTWYHILNYIIDVHLTKGLDNVYLFDLAYEMVIDRYQGQWWFSSQLLYFVCAWIICIAQKDLEIAAIHFIISGFLGAISLSLPLFFIIAKQSTKSNSSGILILFALPLIAGIPLVEQPQFGQVLRLFHFVLGVVPLLSLPKSKRMVHVAFFYTLTFSAVAYAIVSYNVLQMNGFSLMETIKYLYNAFHINGCQASISSDVLFTTITLVLEMWSRKSRLFLVFLIPIFGISIIGTLWLWLQYSDDIEHAETKNK